MDRTMAELVVIWADNMALRVWDGGENGLISVRPASDPAWHARLALSPNGPLFSSQTLIWGGRAFSPSAGACTASSLERAVMVPGNKRTVKSIDRYPKEPIGSLTKLEPGVGKYTKIQITSYGVGFATITKRGMAPGIVLSWNMPQPVEGEGRSQSFVLSLHAVYTFSAVERGPAWFIQDSSRVEIHVKLLYPIHGDNSISSSGGRESAQREDCAQEDERESEGEEGSVKDEAGVPCG
ncbi:hypothetical protein K438DRAFT_1758780 [Mycena galopus ATCC 62051]|nr:hypothetical protein K438DRAFT_1758780 [Mycena galopus ATCC 62051]